MDRDFARAVQRLVGVLGFPVAVDGIPGPETLGAVYAAYSAAQGTSTAPDDPETVKLIAELERDEGRVLHAYQDSLGYWTIGIGRLIDKRRGGGISNEEADLLKRNDIAKVRRQLDEMLPWWRRMSPNRQRAIQNMTFQLGIAGLLKFKATLRHLEAGEFASAAANMRASLWARQTPARAERVIRLIEAG
jgi:lysozyme